MSFEQASESKSHDHALSRASLFFHSRPPSSRQQVFATFPASVTVLCPTMSALDSAPPSSESAASASGPRTKHACDQCRRTQKKVSKSSSHALSLYSNFLRNGADDVLLSRRSSAMVINRLALGACRTARSASTRRTKCPPLPSARTRKTARTMTSHLHHEIVPKVAISAVIKVMPLHYYFIPT